MFYLWQEELDLRHPKMQVFKYNPQLGVQQYCNYQDLNGSINQSLELQDYDHYFLLDDSRFHFFRFDVYREKEETLNYLKTITKEELLFTTVDNIYIQGQPQKFLI